MFRSYLIYLRTPFCVGIHQRMMSILIDSGKLDRYNGVTVDCSKLPESAMKESVFEAMLNESLTHWCETGVRASWFKVPLAQSSVIPPLVKNGFVYHHAKPEFSVLVKWLTTKEPCNIPEYAFTNIGVGALVLDSEDRVLVVKEKRFIQKRMWKYPGGYSCQGETFWETAQREVLEETGIQTKFHSIITLRHQHEFQFGCSDLYIVCYMTPEVDPNSGSESLVPKRCSQEIVEVAWIPLTEVKDQLSEFNKYVLDQFLECREKNVALQVKSMENFIKGRGDYSVYSIIQEAKY